MVENYLVPVDDYLASNGEREVREANGGDVKLYFKTDDEIRNKPSNDGLAEKL